MDRGWRFWGAFGLLIINLALAVIYVTINRSPCHDYNIKMNVPVGTFPDEQIEIIGEDKEGGLVFKAASIERLITVCEVK